MSTPTHLRALTLIEQAAQEYTNDESADMDFRGDVLHALVAAWDTPGDRRWIVARQVLLHDDAPTAAPGALEAEAIRLIVSIADLAESVLYAHDARTRRAAAQGPDDEGKREHEGPRLDAARLFPETSPAELAASQLRADNREYEQARELRAATDRLVQIVREATSETLGDDS